MKTITRLAHLLPLSLALGLPLALGVGGCTSSTNDAATPEPEASEAEIRSVATRFFERSPMSGERCERFRRELENADDGFKWARNQGTVFGLQWDVSAPKTLSDDDRNALVKAGFAAYLKNNGNRVPRGFLRDVKKVGPTTENLDKALDEIGLYESGTNPETRAERAKLLEGLRALSTTRGITIHTGTLHYQVDMSWEGVLFVVDEANVQIVVATGGWGS